MNVYSNMPGVPDMNSMVWMGASQPNPEMTMELMPGESTDMLLEAENPYFTPSLHSLSNISNQSIDDINTINNSQMDSMENLDMMPYMDMKHESNDSSYTEDDSPHPVYMITTATQTLPSPTRKIKPIKHPGLVLKTPIAYQSNTDPSVIPIQKDGIAVCEKCGAIGVKHAFYTRERRFCSMACARGYSGLDPPEPLSMMASGNHHQQPSPQQQMLSSSPTATAAIATTTTPASTTATTTTLDNQNNYHFARHRFSLVGEDDFSNTYIDEELPQLPPPPPPSMMAAVHNMDESLLVRRKPPSELANSHDWDAQLMNDPYFIAAPVTCFKHAPMADIWANVMVGMKAEVENTDCDNASDAFPDSFWVATVMRIVGYKALLRYEGFGSNDTKDFWVSLCSNQVHPVGWCATRGKPLIPPKTIEDKYSDWKDFLSKRLTGARTLPSNFSNKTSDSHKSRFQCGLNLEVVDKNRISQVKVAMVHKIVGKRLNVKYFDLPPDDAGFWCHEDSPLLHPVGWAKRVGHHLVAPVNYLERVNHGLFDEDDATDKLFLPIQIGTMDPYCERGYLINRFRVGMKLEAIDPLNLSSICVATVMNVLRHGYIMIRIDTYESDMTGADWFCYHISSPCIFPVGFCEKYGITLTPPKGYDPTTFHWRTYLEETHNEAASPDLFNSYIPLHGFVQSMKIEAADLMDPRLVCVATVAKVAGRLLKVHFDGWEEEYDQWLDCESSDIYPVGWCQSVGHKLEGPPPVPRVTQPVPKLPKVGMKKRGRKKKLKDQLSPKATLVATTTQTVCTRPADVDPEYEEEQTSVSGSITYEVEEKHEDPAADVMSSTDDYNRGPEAGQEPAGPDQCLPVSSEVQPPPAERKATSYINTSPTTSAKFIPRLVDNSSGGNNNESGGELCPEDWNVFDVAQFLRVNDCANYCDSFSKQKIDGKALMQLNKEDILEYTGGKVGPSLKIYHLIQQLKMKVNPAQIRHMKANIKKFL